MFIQNWKQNIFTIPNLLSLSRLALVPVYVSRYLKAASPRDYHLAGLILAISCLTDAVDGFIARKYNMASDLGKFLDPLADKITQITLAICLSTQYPVLVILVVLLLIKELLQLFGSMLLLHKGIALPGSMMAGKVSTLILFVSLTFLVLFPNVPSQFVTFLALTDSLCLLFAFVTYLMTFTKSKNRC